MSSIIDYVLETLPDVRKSDDPAYDLLRRVGDVDQKIVVRAAGLWGDEKRVKATRTNWHKKDFRDHHIKRIFDDAVVFVVAKENGSILACRYKSIAPALWKMYHSLAGGENSPIKYNVSPMLMSNVHLSYAPATPSLAASIAGSLMPAKFDMFA